MRAVAVGWVLGAFLLQRQAALPSMPLAVLLAIFGTVALLAGTYCSHIQTTQTQADIANDRLRYRDLPLGALRSETLAFRARYRRLLPLSLILLGAATLGFDWAAWRAERRLSTELPVSMEGRDIRVTGRIEGLPIRDRDGARFLLRVEQVHSPLPEGMRPETFASLLRLSWSGGYNNIPRGSRSAVPILEAGQRWTVTVRLKRPHAQANFLAVDFEAWMLQQGVRATGYVTVKSPPVLIPSRADWSHPMRELRALVDRMRGRLAARIDAVLADATHRGVVTALAIGYQGGIAQNDWQRFARTGTNHLVAISGLHIGLVACFAVALARSVWRGATRLGCPLPLWVATPRIATLCGLVAAGAFVALAGCGIPAQRAFLMLLFVFIALQVARSPAPSLVLCWALLLVVIIDPWAVTSAGLWLSFGAVGAILYAVVSRGNAVELAADVTSRDKQAPPLPSRPLTGIASRPAGPWRRAIRRVLPLIRATLGAATRVQLAVTIALVPATVSWFGQVPLLGPFANALAIPWVSFLVVPGVLLGVMLPAPLDVWAFRAAHEALALLLVALDRLAAPEWALLKLPSPDPISLFAALLGLAFWLGPRALPLQRFAPVLCVPLFLSRPAALAEGEFRVTMFDIGQGNAALIETRGRRLLYDTGPPIGSSDSGERVVLPHMHRHGIDKLDTLIVSHNHDDHYGGAASVLQGMPVGRFLASLPAEQPLWALAARQQTRAERCRAGQSWHWDGISFDVLWPSDPDAGLPPNAMSCVVRVSNGRHAVLLTGDIEAPQEAALLRQGVVLQAGVLMAPHHGSRTSSSEAFIDAVGPSYVVFQMGYRNRHRHPSKDVVPRYHLRDVQMFRSDEDGAVRFESRGPVIEAMAYRRVQRRYWMGR